MAIRPPKHSSQGFTLVEILVTLVISGIIIGFATPSFLSLNKPLKNASLQFKAQLSLIRSKAISSNKAYRIRPKFSTLAGYSDGVIRNFVVEYADNCKKPENDVAPISTRWQMASELDLDLPPNIGIPSAAITLPDVVGSVTNLNWTGAGIICFNNRGLLENTTTNNTTTRIVLRDFQGFSRARAAYLELTTIGNVDINTYAENTPGVFTKIGLNSQENPEF